MELRSTERRASAYSGDNGELLADRYAQLMRWAIALTRNDRTKAEEIVQELCLYITLARPDFSHVTNLDGYLYTCLRHVYTSSLARASRDALRLVSIEDYDSFAMAVSSRLPGDPLQRQNDLRRVCAYAVWRKETSKTDSYFILHFFHGYGREEIASVARVTMAAIYNKLKAARAEVGAYLQNAGKLRLIDREPPSPNLFWHVVPVAELFAELRQTILRAKLTACLPEQELSAFYTSGGQTPIPCELLAHIVSCERCLAVVDGIGRRPTLKDREPLDVFGYSPGEGGDAPGGSGDTHARTMEDVERKWKRTYDHRPRSLSIALNGEVIASHDVRSEHNRLTARIDAASGVNFIEVFSEQDVRLALLPVELEPAGTPAAQRLRVLLSDERWLELKLNFDGLGLESEVSYFDPTLSQTEEEEAAPAVFTRSAEPAKVRLWERLRIFAVPVMAWAFAVVFVVGLGCWVYLHHQAPLGAASVLHRASQIEISTLGRQTEHQVVRLEEGPVAGETRIAATIDFWKDGEGSRYIRRLYDDQRQLVAVEWHGNNQGVAKKRGLRRTDGLISQFWSQDLSARAFASMEDGEPKIRKTASGYEITKTGPSQRYPQLISATLVLNAGYQAVEQRFQVQTARGARQLRFIQESYDLKPAHSVPDDTFDPDSAGGSASRRGRFAPGTHGLAEGGGVELADLEIQVLYVLRALDADTGVPIEVTRTPAGQVKVEGVVTSDSLRRQIDTQLRSLGSLHLLQLKIAASGRALHSAAASLPRMEAYEASQTRFIADTPVRQSFESQGFAGEDLNRAVQQFSLDALTHAQKALQHGYALDRLGNVATSGELRTVSDRSQHEWAEMVQYHAHGVQNELRALRKQLVILRPHVSGDQIPQADSAEIQNPAQFAQASRRLLDQLAGLNERVGELFTADGRASGEVDLETLLKATMNTEALNDSSQMSEFATRLSEAANGKRAAAKNE